MREMNFPEMNLKNRWCGIKGMWDLLQGGTRRFVKRRLESFTGVELSHRLGCRCYQSSVKHHGYRNGSYVRDLLTSYWWLRFWRCRVFVKGVFSLKHYDPILTTLKTSNPIERYLEEIQRRIIPIGALNNTKRVEKILYGIIACVLNQYQGYAMFRIY